MRPDGIVRVVDGRQDAPNSIDLAVILVDLANEEENGKRRDREDQSGDHGVGGEVEVFQCIRVSYRVDEGIGEVEELRNVRFHGFAEVGTVLDGRDDWQGHAGLRDEHLEGRKGWLLRVAAICLPRS